MHWRMRVEVPRGWHVRAEIVETKTQMKGRTYTMGIRERVDVVETSSSFIV